MGQFGALLNNLTLRQKITIAVAVIAVIAAITSLAKWNRERDFKPLYTGLASEDAGAVVARLKETAIDYRVGDGGASILVPSAKVPEVRLQMAAAGLPRTGRIGFELFDKTNFGATDFTEQVNYHRALEGELERSIMSLAEVERARVHLSFAKDSLFLEQRQPAKASVMVRLRPAARLSPQNVLSVTHLVASAVEGLTPDAVSVLDMNGNLLSRARRAGTPDSLQGSATALEYRQSIEKDLMAKIGATLEPVLGAEKFRTGVSVDCDLSSGEQSEESFDPARSVMVTSQKTEDISAGPGSAGVPGTTSNLPRPPASRSGGGYGTTRRTENISYQSSRLVRRVTLPQGTVKRMSVAVLVDHSVRWEGAGKNARRVIEPPSPDKLKVIRELVAAATGLQTDRGDQLIVESLPFETTLTADRMPDGPAQPAQPSGVQLPFAISIPANLAVIGGVAAGAVLSILSLAALWLMRRRKRRRIQVAQATKAMQARPDAADSLEKQLEERYAEQAARRELEAQEVLNSLKLPAVKTKKTEVLTRQLAEETKKDPQSMAHVIRTWMHETE